MFKKRFCFLAVGGIQHHEGRLVAPAVRQGVKILVIEGEEHRVDRRAEIGGQHRFEFILLGGAVEQAAVHAIRCGGDPHRAFVIRDPAGDIAGVLRHQRGNARLHIDLVDIEDLRNALIVLYQDVLRVVPQVIHDGGLDLLDGREVLDIATLHVHGNHMEIFIAAEILGEEKMIIALPEIARDVTGGLAGQALGFGKVRRTAVRR